MRNLALVALIGCKPVAPTPPRTPPPAAPIADAEVDIIAVAARDADTIAHYCSGRPACGAPATGPVLPWPTGWTAQFFQDGDSCSAALAIAGGVYILDDLGPTCGDPKFDRCEGRAAISQAGPWVGIVTTHPRVNPYEDTMPGTPADEELRICTAAMAGFACSDVVPIGKLKCHAYGDGPTGGDGLAVNFSGSRLDVTLTPTTAVLAWEEGPHDVLLTAGTFALSQAE